MANILSVEDIKTYGGLRDVKTIEGVVDNAFAGTFPVDGRDSTFIELRGEKQPYQFTDKLFRVDRGEKVRIYTGGEEVGESGNISVEAIEILDEQDRVKMTYVGNMQYIKWAD